ncbi:vesicle-associated membrane protein 7-like [Amphiura filiformis]|uniref:vesicle-associated membrane protein 7-like n=1 Tax=Amphiura filiformis TaxID=82378 RepID=UPI003B21F775
MPILFSSVSRGTTVLVNNAACTGNFTEVAEQILAKIPPGNAKLTYSHGSYLFHYISDDRIIFLCIADDEFERSKAFLFLGEVKQRFQAMYGTRAQTALPFAMNSEFSRVLSTQMKHYSQQKDKVGEIQTDLDELKGIMVKNIVSITNRGEKLELLIDKTEDLESTSLTFKKNSRNLSRAMCMKNAKITIILVIVVIVIIYFIVSAACGGLAWPHCTK